MTGSLSIILAGMTLFGILAATHAQPHQTVRLAITGGHETEPVDHGRPVVLIANALGVKTEVFRAAFSHVTPAPGGTTPKPEQVRQNKEALLSALAPYGVTHDQLDRVSDYYRYRPESGKLWPTRPAVAYATLSGSVVKSITVTDAGSGYSSAPDLSVPDHPGIKLEAKLAFGINVKTNGSVAAISALPAARR